MTATALQDSSTAAAFSLDPALAFVLRFALAGVLAHAALHKLRDVSGFRSVVADYRLLPRAFTTSVATTLPGIEIGLAAALILFPGGGAPLAVAALLVIYGGAIAINLRRGRRDIDCGCSGPHARMPLGASLVVRNIVVAALALVAALPTQARTIGWLDAVSVVGGGLALLLVYRSSEVALANHRRARHLGLIR